MKPILQIRLEEESAVAKAMKSKAQRDFFNSLTEGPGKAFAEAYRDITADLLSKNHKYDNGFPVGATGKASENFELALNKPAVGYSVWVVSEGNKTEANEVIRKGMPPGTDVSIPTLREWARNKGLKFGRPNERKPILSQKSRGGKTYSRAFPGTRQQANAFLYRVQELLKEYGTRRQKGFPNKTSFGSNWSRRFHQGGPIGSYDYPQYTFRLMDPNKALRKLNNAAYRAIVEFYGSGRKSGGEHVWDGVLKR